MPVVAEAATQLRLELHVGSRHCKQVLPRPAQGGGDIGRGGRLHGLASGRLGRLGDGPPVDGLEREITPDKRGGDRSTHDCVGGQSADRAGEAFWLWTLLPACDFEQPVIGLSLLFIAQDGIGANDAPKSFRSFRVAGIEIGMVRFGCLAERSSQALGVIVRQCLKQIIESLHGGSLKYRYCLPVPPHWHVFNQSAVKQTLPRKRQVKKPKTNKISAEWQNKDWIEGLIGQFRQENTGFGGCLQSALHKVPEIRAEVARE